MAEQITEITAPDYTDPARDGSQSNNAFSNNMAAAFAYMKSLGSQLASNFVSEANALATEVETNAAAAETAKTDSESARDLAEGHANFVGNWSDQSGAANVPYSVLHNGAIYILRVDMADVTTVEPGVTASWENTWYENPLGGLAGALETTGSLTLTADSVPFHSITPEHYHETVTLPDATTMKSAGALSFVFYNKGPYDIRIVDNGGNILRHVGPRQKCGASLISKSTANGEWAFEGGKQHGLVAVGSFELTGNTADADNQMICIQLDTSRTILLFTLSSNLYGVVYDKSDGSFGTVVTVDTGYIEDNFNAIEIDTDKIFCFSCVHNNTTNTSAVVLSISGKTITVNTPATPTLGGSIQARPNICLSGSAILLTYSYDATPSNLRAIAFSVSGTTVTAGTEINVGTTSDENAGYLVDMNDSGLFMAIFPQTASSMTHMPISVSGTTATAGTGGTFTISASGGSFIVEKLDSSNLIVFYYSSSWKALVVSVSGTTSTDNSPADSTLTDTTCWTVNIETDVWAVACDGGTSGVNIFTRSGTTVTAGTMEAMEAIEAGATPFGIYDNTDLGYACFVAYTQSLNSLISIKVSNNSGDPSWEIVDILNLDGSVWSYAFNGNKFDSKNHRSALDEYHQWAPANHIYGETSGAFAYIGNGSGYQSGGVILNRDGTFNLISGDQIPRNGCINNSFLSQGMESRGIRWFVADQFMTGQVILNCVEAA